MQDLNSAEPANKALIQIIDLALQLCKVYPEQNLTKNMERSFELNQNMITQYVHAFYEAQHHPQFRF